MLNERTRRLRGRDRDQAVTVDRELAGISAYGQRLAEFQEVKRLDEGKMRMSSRLLPHDATVDMSKMEGLSRMTKAKFRAGARELRVPPLSVPFSRRTRSTFTCRLKTKLTLAL